MSLVCKETLILLFSPHPIAIGVIFTEGQSYKISSITMHSKNLLSIGQLSSPSHSVTITLNKLNALLGHISFHTLLHFVEIFTLWPLFNTTEVLYVLYTLWIFSHMLMMYGKWIMIGRSCLC